LDADATYMAWMERLYAVELAVVADDGNDGGRGRGGKAGAPPVPPAATASPASMVRRWRWQRWRRRRRRRRGWWTAVGTVRLTAMGEPSRTAAVKTAMGAPHPAPGG
jgi:hypothetical protein